MYLQPIPLRLPFTRNLSLKWGTYISTMAVHRICTVHCIQNTAFIRQYFKRAIIVSVSNFYNKYLRLFFGLNITHLYGMPPYNHKMCHFTPSLTPYKSTPSSPPPSPGAKPRLHILSSCHARFPAIQLLVVGSELEAVFCLVHWFWCTEMEIIDLISWLYS